MHPLMKQYVVSTVQSVCVAFVDGAELLDDNDPEDFDPSKLRLHVWSTTRETSSSRAAGTTASPTADETAENQLMYVVLGTVLGVVVLVVVVFVVTCTWRHQQQPRRAVGMAVIYLLNYLLTYRRGYVLYVCCYYYYYYAVVKVGFNRWLSFGGYSECGA